MAYSSQLPSWRQATTCTIDNPFKYRIDCVIDEVEMEILEEGKGELLAWRDPDEQRRWILENKSRRFENKQVSLKEAIARFVRDGNYIAMGGFGHVRVSMAAVYEIIRQRKRNLVMVGKPGVHDSDVLIASGCVDKVEVAYCFGHELRGLSPASRRAAD